MGFWSIDQYRRAIGGFSGGSGKISGGSSGVSSSFLPEQHTAGSNRSNDRSENDQRDFTDPSSSSLTLPDPSIDLSLPTVDPFEFHPSEIVGLLSDRLVFDSSPNSSSLIAGIVAPPTFSASRGIAFAGRSRGAFVSTQALGQSFDATVGRASSIGQEQCISFVGCLIVVSLLAKVLQHCCLRSRSSQQEESITDGRVGRTSRQSFSWWGIAVCNIAAIVLVLSYSVDRLGPISTAILFFAANNEIMQLYIRAGEEVDTPDCCQPDEVDSPIVMPEPEPTTSSESPPPPPPQHDVCDAVEDDDATSTRHEEDLSSCWMVPLECNYFFIQIKSITGSWNMRLRVDQFNTVSDIKQMISGHYKAMPSQQQMTFNRQMLDNERTLVSYGMFDGCVVSVSLPFHAAGEDDGRPNSARHSSQHKKQKKVTKKRPRDKQQNAQCAKKGKASSPKKGKASSVKDFSNGGLEAGSQVRVADEVELQGGNSPLFQDEEIPTNTGDGLDPFVAAQHYGKLL